MGDKFRRVSGLHRAEYKTFPAGLCLVTNAKESIAQAQVWANKEKRASRNAGLFFVIFLRARRRSM